MMYHVRTGHSRSLAICASELKLTRFLSGGGDDRALLAQLGKLLLREDRDFHTIQAVEAATRQYSYWQGQPEGINILVAATRYLAAHAPTVRAQGQTL